jgi:hypothetical protein
MSSPLPLPPLAALLTQSHREALGAFAAAGWRPWAHPIGLDAERRRTLNVDLTEPEMAYLEGDVVRAVAHTEIDRNGDVTLVEIVSAEPAEPLRVAAALWPGHPGEPRTGGGAAAREWIWGPESGATATVGGEPVRLWVCAEQAYGDRLWAVATVVRRGEQDDD